MLVSADSMIRVGGDYQAQIPEFKPGKLGGRKAQQKETIEGIKIDDKKREREGITSVSPVGRRHRG